MGNAPEQKDLQSTGYIKIEERVRSRTKFELDVVAQRYNAAPSIVLGLAPMLFVLAAEGSLAERRTRLEAAKAALTKLSDAAGHHLFALAEQDQLEECLERERDSIAKRDLDAKHIAAWHEKKGYSMWSGWQITSSRNAILELIDPITITIDRMIFEEIDSYSISDEWNMFSEILLFEKELDVFSSGSAAARLALERGDVSLKDVPKELFDPEMGTQRAEWLEARLAPASRAWLDQLGNIGLDLD